MHEDEGDHQEQVKELIKKTADSLDNLALKILFISVQQNNLELCIQYAVDYAPDLGKPTEMVEVVQNCLLWFRHSYYDSYDYEKTEDVGVRGLVRGVGRGRGIVRVLHQNIKEVTTFMQLKITDVRKRLFYFASTKLSKIRNPFWLCLLLSSFAWSIHSGTSLHLSPS
jgi:hypothetical protein